MPWRIAADSGRKDRTLCWSLEASVAVTAAGVAASVFSYARKDPPAIWATIGYFTLMEGLQAGSYSVIDACGAPANQTLTVLSFVRARRNA